MKIQVKKWKVLIVAHKKIYPEFYQGDPLFDETNFEILNVGEQQAIVNSGNIKVVNQYDISKSRKLGKRWAESEGLLNYWLSDEWKKYDYIGFIHYDLEWKIDKRVRKVRRTNITQRINDYLSLRDNAHISFENYSIGWDIDQRIMADISQPDINIGDGVNCYAYILDDYNEFFNKSYSIDDLQKCKVINLCSCFLIDIYHFDEMMQWFEFVVNKGQLTIFQPERKPGALAERYFGVYLAFAYNESLDISLIHHWNDGRK